jgi:hypothetical protein
VDVDPLGSSPRPPERAGALGPGSRAGGTDDAHCAAPYLFTAWTSTSCLRPHGVTLCGWLLPGPWSVAPAPPRETATCAAVAPLPYFFDVSGFVDDPPGALDDGVHVAAPGFPPTAHDVFFAVVFDGFTPPFAAASCAFGRAFAP